MWVLQGQRYTKQQVQSPQKHEPTFPENHRITSSMTSIEPV
jgi:hypothetical protein